MVNTGLSVLRPPSMFHYAALQSSIMSSVKLFILRDTELHRILEENILPKAMK